MGRLRLQRRELVRRRVHRPVAQQGAACRRQPLRRLRRLRRRLDDAQRAEVGGEEAALGGREAAEGAESAQGERLRVGGGELCGGDLEEGGEQPVVAQVGGEGGEGGEEGEEEQREHEDRKGHLGTGGALEACARE